MRTKLLTLSVAAVLASTPIAAEERTFRELLDNFEAEAARQMVETMPDLNARDAQGDTPLCLVISAGHNDNYAAFLRLMERGANPDIECADGLRPLTKAIGFGNYPAVETLLDRGASFDYEDSQSMLPPLAMAYFTGRAAIAELLKERGAYIEEHVRVAGVRMHAYQAAYLEEIGKQPEFLDEDEKHNAMWRARLAALRATLVHETNAYQYALEDLWLRKAAFAEYKGSSGEHPYEWQKRIQRKAILEAMEELKASGGWSADKLPPPFVDINRAVR